MLIVPISSLLRRRRSTHRTPGCLNYVKAPWVLAPLLEHYQLLVRFSGDIDLALVRFD